MLSRLAIVGLSLLASALAAEAADNRVWLAQQNDYVGKKGFSLNLENMAPNQPLHLNTVKLVLAVGDGKVWRYVQQTPAWQLDKEYTVKAVVTPDTAKLYLDGALLDESKGAFIPASGETVDSFRTADWANSPTDYLIGETSLSLRTETGRHADNLWPAPSAGATALRMFQPDSPKRLAWTTRPGETLTVMVKFRAVKVPDLRTLSPFVDRYGQPIPGDFAGKVRNDADLKAAIADEAAHAGKWEPPAQRDQYGGETNADWHGAKTGYYGIAKRNGHWWLISPEGNPLFYVGVCTVDRAAWERTPVTGREFLFAELPPRDGAFEQSWEKDPWGGSEGVDYVSFYTANLVRKYGAGWYNEAEKTIRRRLGAWGFAGVGKWGGTALDSTPNIAVIYYPGVPNLAGHPDVFDPSVQSAFREALRKEIEPRKTDPWLIGWSVGNEYDEIVKKGEVTGIMAKPASTPAKRALIDGCLERTYGGDVAAAAKAWNVSAATRDDLYATTPAPSDVDVESMRETYADRYYGFIYETVKALDPNHLYLGCWLVPGWWENQSDWGLIAAHCDVFGFDHYSESFTNPDIDRWVAAADKPILCGEFSFPPFDDGGRGLGVYAAVSTNDSKDAADHYRRWLHDAASNRYCVGVAYFQYRDQPITGRGPGGGANLVIGEHYAFGLVDITDKPKWDFVDAVRAANLGASRIRRQATAAAGRSSNDLPKTE